MSKPADDLISETEDRKQQVAEDAPRAFEWFEDRDGELFPLAEAAASVSEAEEWAEDRARRAVIGVTDDTLDPVQVVARNDDRYVGIIDFVVFEAEGAYGFEEYDATRGRRKNVVCARCVEQEDHPGDCFRAVAGFTTYPDDDATIPADAGYKPLLDRVTQHYTHEHEHGPESVDVAASLVSGTTISSNTAWHDGNVSGGSNISIGAQSVSISPQGAGSGLNADQVDGQDAADIGGGSTVKGYRTVYSTTDGTITNVSVTGFTLDGTDHIFNIIVDGLTSSISTVYFTKGYSGGNFTSVSLERWQFAGVTSLTLFMTALGVTA